MRAGARVGDETTRPLAIRSLFARIVPRYDLLNHLLSFNLDRRWRRRAARLLARWLERPGVRVLDLCCGTGDSLRALEEQAGKAANPLLLGCDFCHPMLLAARRKVASPVLVEADALQLPFPDASFDVVATAFGFRNLTDYHRGLAEIRRVLRPGGVVAIVEFSWPSGRLLGAAYGFYVRCLLPRVGGWISGVPEAYRYLPDSVARFPSPEQLAQWMRAAGFRQVRCVPMSGGIVTIHLGVVEE